MSDDLTKYKKSKRLAKTKAATMKQVKIAKSYGLRCDVPHRFAKTKATSCGDSNCYMCGNPRKFFNEKTIREQQFDDDFKNDL